MEIYIYSLILALYPVLWFLSREEEGSGMTGMAEFLYTRGRKLGQKIKGRGIFRESGIRRDLSLLYPYGRLEREERHFYVERIRIVLMIILAGDILAAAGYAAAEGRMLLGDGGLAREEIGGEDRSTQLDAYIVQESGDGTEKGEYKGTGEEGGTETDGTAMRAAWPIRAATGWRSVRESMTGNRLRPWQNRYLHCFRKGFWEKTRVWHM